MDDDTKNGTGGEGADRKQQQQQQQEEEEDDNDNPVGTVVVGFSFMAKKMETMAEVGLSQAEVIRSLLLLLC